MSGISLSNKKLIADKRKAVKDQEKRLERKLTDYVKKQGGLSLKFTSPYFTGMPDRLVLLPKGLIYFAEIKTKGQKLSARQKVVKTMLENLGFKVIVIDSDDSLTYFFRELENNGV